MSKKCPGLEGTEEYAYGSNSNPPTLLQWNVIRFIERHTTHEFSGCTSGQAYDFIGSYAEKAEIISKGEVYITRIS